MLRFNLSKSGIGVSSGIKGLRVGTGPRGTYIHAGRGGLYYREYLFRAPRSQQTPRPADLAPPVSQPSESTTLIGSAAASSINDSNADTLLAEIRTKRALFSWFMPAIIACGAIVAMGFASNVGIGTGLLFLSLLLLIPIYFYDQKRKRVVVMYDLDSAVETAFRALYDALLGMRNCGAIWSVMSHAVTGDYKRHAGASALLQRKPATIGDGPVPFLKTNVAIPQLRLHQDVLYFLPDRIFITNPQGIGAVSYPDLHATSRVGRFIEDGPVPRGARQVDTTWRFVNKNGTPDRRFANNRQLPILAYQEVLFASTTGIRAYLQISSSSGANGFLGALASIQHLRTQPTAPASGPSATTFPAP